MYYDCHTHTKNKANDIIAIYNEQIKDHFLLNSDQYFSIGLHPWHIEAYEVKDVSILEQNIFNNNKCIAIGECGLDKLKQKNLWQKQLDLFELQIELAKKLNVPLIIHCVKAYNECLELLGSKEGIFHGYNKNQTLAKQITKKGHIISFGPASLYENSQLIDTIRNTNFEQILLETDNANISIKEIYEQVAKIRNCTQDAFNLQIALNFKRTFNYE